MDDTPRYTMTRYRHDPEFRKRRREYINEYQKERYRNDPAYRERVRQRKLEYMERIRSDPKKLERHLEYHRISARKRRIKELEQQIADMIAAGADNTEIRNIKRKLKRCQKHLYGPPRLSNGALRNSNN